MWNRYMTADAQVEISTLSQACWAGNVVFCFSQDFIIYYTEIIMNLIFSNTSRNIIIITYHCMLSRPNFYATFTVPLMQWNTASTFVDRWCDVLLLRHTFRDPLTSQVSILLVISKNKNNLSCCGESPFNEEVTFYSYFRLTYHVVNLYKFTNW